jgi:hypothetical protein
MTAAERDQEIYPRADETPRRTSANKKDCRENYGFCQLNSIPSQLEEKDQEPKDSCRVATEFTPYDDKTYSRP